MHCPPQLAAWLAARRASVSAADEELEREHLERVLRFEAMGRWPTRRLTAHFVGALAVKR